MTCLPPTGMRTLWINSMASLRTKTEIPMFCARWELREIISLSWQQKLNLVFLANPLYSVVGSLISLKTEFPDLGLPATTCMQQEKAGDPLWLEGARRAGDTNPEPHCAGSPGFTCSHLQTAGNKLELVWSQQHQQHSQAKFTASWSTSRESLTIRLHISVYCNKMKERVGCSVSFNHLCFCVRLLNMLFHKSIWVTKAIEQCRP